jgi:beta-glucosidase
MRAYKTNAARKLRYTVLLAGAVTLAACSNVSFTDPASWIGLSDAEAKTAAKETAPQPAPVATPAPASSPAETSFATSTVVHPEIWPANPPPKRNAAVEAEVARLLAQMTLEEKIGQMLQPDIRSTTPDDVTRYHLGSVLNGGSAGPHGNLRAPAPDWLKAADEYYDASMRTRLHIPLMWGIDAVHGHGHIIGATIFPHNIGLGAMRDPDLVRRLGEIAAQEIRVTGQDWTFAPTIAVIRDDRWGRSYEGFGEEPRLVTENAVAMVEGLQGKPGSADYLKGGHVLASIKHFIGDGGTDNGINAGDMTYSEPAVRDLFGAPYIAAIKAGAKNVMVSYSGWRGLKMHGQKGLVSDVLVGRLGFDGFVISDYHGIADVPGCTRSNCPQAVNAGVDMIMTADDWKTLYGNLINQVSSGQIPMARINEAVSRILRVKIESGLMAAGRPSQRPYAGHYEMLGSPEHRAVARQAVRESLVLLKNDGGLLPLSPRSHVLVAGEGAQNMSKQTGGWTITWQGTETSRADFPHGTTIYEGIKANVEAAGGIVDYSLEGSFRQRPDVAIVVFGEDAYAEGKGDINTLEYQPGTKRDLKLLQRLQSQGIPVVAVFLSGRPLYVTPEINAANAFVAAFWPGTEGEGVSDLLFAHADGSVAYDFRGRLSFSWPRSPDQYANNIGTEPYFPLFPFGYGLTYGAPQNIGPLPTAVPAQHQITVPAAPATAPMPSAQMPSAPVRSALVPPAPVSPASVSPAGTAEQSVILDNGAPTSGWNLYVGGERVVTRASSKATQAGLTATRTAAGVNVTWATRVPVSFHISGTPADFSGEADRGLGLAMTLRVDKAPESHIVLAMGCGPLCGGQLDFTDTLRALADRGGFATLNVPLACLKDAGADLSNVPTGFALTATKGLDVTIQSVKISREGEPLGCAQVPSVTAAAAMTGPGHAASADPGAPRSKHAHGSKKKKSAATATSSKKSAVHTGRKSSKKRRH